MGRVLPKPGRLPYRNKCVIIIEDIDLDAGTLNFEAIYDEEPDFSFGPQTPAEQVSALLQTFAKRNILGEHRVGAVLLPEEWGQG